MTDSSTEDDGLEFYINPTAVLGAGMYAKGQGMGRGREGGWESHARLMVIATNSY